MTWGKCCHIVCVGQSVSQSAELHKNQQANFHDTWWSGALAKKDNYGADPLSESREKH